MVTAAAREAAWESARPEDPHVLLWPRLFTLAYFHDELAVHDKILARTYRRSKFVHVHDGRDRQELTNVRFQMSSRKC